MSVSSQTEGGSSSRNAEKATLHGVAGALYESIRLGDPGDDRWFQAAALASSGDYSLHLVIWDAVREILDRIEMERQGGSQREIPATLLPLAQGRGREAGSSVVARSLYDSLRSRDPDNLEWWWQVGTLMTCQNAEMDRLIWEAVKQMVSQLQASE